MSMIFTDSPGWYPYADASPLRPFTDSPGWSDPHQCSVQVRLGDLEIHTRRVSPRAGTWLLQLRELIDGWHGLGDASRSWTHWSGDGSSRGALKFPSRPLSLSLTLKGSRAGGAGSVAEGLEALSRLHRTTLQVVEDGLGREMDVSVEPMRVSSESLRFAAVTLPLVADDPLRYGSGERDLSNGTVSLPNRGDQVAWPVLESSGPHGELSITHPGGTWTVPALDAGLRRTYDFRHGRTYNTSGQRIWGSHTGSGPRPRVEAQGWTEWTISGKGSGSLTLRRFEAWS